MDPLLKGLYSLFGFVALVLLVKIATSVPDVMKEFKKPLTFPAEEVHTERFGAQSEPNFKLFYRVNGTLEYISPWHNLPMYPRKHNHDYVNIVVEISKGTAAKYELSKELLHNPIMHDAAPANSTSTKKFRTLYKPIDWNYGFIPQTYAEGDKLKIEKFKPDGDVLDVIDIGKTSLALGEIATIKILGALPLIDQGEVDWKIIGINVVDENANRYTTLQDVEENEPERLEAIRSFYRKYKVHEGGTKNSFKGEPKQQRDAVVLAYQSHLAYFKLIDRKCVDERTLSKTESKFRLDPLASCTRRKSKQS